MHLEIRRARQGDFAFLCARDTHVDRAELRDVVDRGRVLVALGDGEPAAWLRWNRFWDEHPFMNMLYVLEEHRGLGIGRDLVTAWERSCREQGHGFVVTSTSSTENAAHFYRRLGYVDAGYLDLPGEPRELILLHAL